jgi:protein SCO1/2
VNPRALAVLGAAALAGAGAGIALAIVNGRGTPAPPAAFHAQATWKTGEKPASTFSLLDERGRSLSLAGERGRVVILTFLDSRCRRACPVEGRELAELGRRLGRTNSQLLVVSVDPWADTAASARAFAAKAHWTLPWHWLLGSRAQLRPVWARYSIAVKWTKADILHTVALYVIDREGYQRAAYLFPLRPAEVASDIRRIAAS